MTHNQRKISEFMSNLAFDTLPPPVIHQARRIILDTLGCLLAGIPTPLGRRVARLGSTFPQPGGATIIGTATDRSPFMAAMAHGFMANALDGDDGHRASLLHAGGVIVPAALAAAEEEECSGRQFIEAIVAGYELAHRAGIVSQRGDIYFGSAYGSTFGAAAACARILGLTVEETLYAMGIADMHAPNCMLMGWIDARRIPMIKEGMGWSAATGLMAAHMARAGITGTLSVFEGREDISRIDRLGHEYEIEKNYFKAFPCCRWSQAPLENLLKLRQRHALTPAKVKKIEVHTFGKAVRLDQTAPPTAEDAQYSIPYVLATGLVTGGFTPQDMRVERLTDESILRQAGKVTLIKEPIAEAQYPEFTIAEVSVTTTTGEVFTQGNQSVHGDWDHPLSDATLEKKFKSFTRGILNPADIVAIIEKIRHLENVESLKEFIASVHHSVDCQAPDEITR